MEQPLKEAKGVLLPGQETGRELIMPQANYSTPPPASKPPPALLPSPLLARLQGSLLVPPVLLPGQAGSLQGGLGLGGPSLSAL